MVLEAATMSPFASATMTPTKPPVRATLPRILTGCPGRADEFRANVTARETSSDVARREIRRLKGTPDILFEGDGTVDVLADRIVDRLLALETDLFDHEPPAPRDQQQAEAPDQRRDAPRPAGAAQFRRQAERLRRPSAPLMAGAGQSAIADRDGNGMTSTAIRPDAC